MHEKKPRDNGEVSSDLEECMGTTRREVLLLATCAASRIAAAQDATSEWRVANSSGINIAPYGDRSVPAFTVSLPEEGEGVAAVVEMPEHAWDDGVAIEYHVLNPDNRPYAEVQAITCIKLYRPFTDVFLER